MSKRNICGESFGGLLWFAGWLFTIGLSQLVWWKAILGIALWPYYLAVFLR